MKKYAAIAGVIVLSGGIYYHAFGDSFWGYSSYSCSQGPSRFVHQQGSYYFSGPVFVPKPGYTYAFGPTTYDGLPTAPSSTIPADAAVELTLIPPQNILDVPLPPLTVVPPLQVQYSFSSTVPIRKFTIHINKTFALGDTQISCQVTGTT
jgi:hypothetical protein